MSCPKGRWKLGLESNIELNIGLWSALDAPGGFFFFMSCSHEMGDIWSTVKGLSGWDTEDPTEPRMYERPLQNGGFVTSLFLCQGQPEKEKAHGSDLRTFCNSSFANAPSSHEVKLPSLDLHLHSAL